MAKGFDCATRLNVTSAANLKAAGYEYAARYLGPRSNWKTFDSAEANAIIGAGLKLISIFEKNSTYPSYFTKAQGVADANEAMQYAKAVGQPEGTAIYFTVDYGAGPLNMGQICDYLDGVNSTIKGYDVGLYGSYSVMNAVRGKVKYLWQTYAWSGGQTATFVNMKQYKNGVTDAGVQIDQNDIYATVGAWNEQSAPAAKINTSKYPVEPVSTGNPIVARVKVIADSLNCRQHPDINSPVLFVAKQGQIYNVTANINDWHEVIIDNDGHNGYLFGNNGQYLTLAVNDPTPQPKVQDRQYVTVVKGDTVSGIAKRCGTTIQQIKLLNGLANVDKIFPGERLRVK